MSSHGNELPRGKPRGIKSQDIKATRQAVGNEPSSIQIPTDKIAELCRRWKITELALFGSVLRDDFRPESDLDVLVTFAPGAARRFYDLLETKEELEAIFGREVDLVEKRLVEASENYIRRNHIVKHLQTIYVT